MTAPTRIFVGDLVRALSVAGDAGGGNWPEIAAMLGFGPPGPVPPRDGELEPRDRLQQAQPVEGTATGEMAAAVAALPDSSDIGELIEFDLERSTAPAEPIVPGAPAPSPARAVSSLPLRPLFDALWERGILIEAAGMPCAEGELAVLRAVELIARGDALRELPVERIQSVSKGCQILLDTGLGMQPFASDGRQMVRSLRRAVGAAHTQVLTFTDCPTLGVMTDRYKDERYAAPANGAMVLAISDLCLGGPRSAIREAEPEEWLTVAKWVHDAGNSLVVLNPYPPARWPASVAAQVPIVHWAATTVAANVRRARRGLRR